MDLVNCTNCGSIYVKNPIRDICDKCYKEEEQAFDKVNSFLKQRQNRTASMIQVVEETGVEEDLILKFIRKGRIRLVNFPNLGYPCEKCGKPIQRGRLCDRCAKEFKSELEVFEQEQERQKEIAERQVTYHAIDEKYRGKR
ncbi:TIGR03826 family flagellar region protein [Bacillus andreraoultii]|uniref:TIGR03826 family flagellar region protein n=1 Tax=Bacillus andreraoultii TaxID=1499685 RepID=UPI00053A0B70|nr:TIGR03826 family flagellar region protein [Bacillus andreraoultii]